MRMQQIFVPNSIRKNGNLLLVVNTKQAALTMFQKLKEQNSEFATVLHLSTNMCPAHRRTVDSANAGAVGSPSATDLRNNAID